MPSCNDTRIIMTITVYSKPACVQCTATTRALDRQGIDYSIVDISENAEAFALVQGLGYRQVPVGHCRRAALGRFSPGHDQRARLSRGMAGLVFFSSRSENTRRFVARLG